MRDKDLDSRAAAKTSAVRRTPVGPKVRAKHL
jgi:hypothetical protein